MAYIYKSYIEDKCDPDLISLWFLSTYNKTCVSFKIWFVNKTLCIKNTFFARIFISRQALQVISTPGWQMAFWTPFFSFWAEMKIVITASCLVLRKLFIFFISFITFSHSSQGFAKYEKGKISVRWKLNYKIKCNWWKSGMVAFQIFRNQRLSSHWLRLDYISTIAFNTVRGWLWSPSD